MLIDGKEIATQIEREIQQVVAQLSDRIPRLVMVIVGDNPASQTYVSRKGHACKRVGVDSYIVKLPVTISEGELIREIDRLNRDDTVDGILVQLPLPSHINYLRVISSLSPEKDVDGLHPLNAGRMLMGDLEAFIPCTPLGIKVLLERSGISVCGKHTVIIGRSSIVGRPLSVLLGQNISGGNATVTLAHSRSSNLKELCLLADILVVAIGSPLFISADMVREGAVVIDVGINRINNSEGEDGHRIVGDVDFDQVRDKCSHITPVPGGVGPMTIAMLLSNTLKSYLNRFSF